VHPKHAR